MNIINSSFFKRIYQKLTGIQYVVSYAQAGEDIIIESLIGARRISDFTYLDIGANHPIRFSNTFKFYEMGYRGVCVEPDPVLFAKLSATRKRDTCLNVGIGGLSSGRVDYYVMENSVLNTFSKEEAVRNEQSNYSKIKKVIQIPLQTVESVIDQYFENKAPVFVNIDVEGLDEEILKSFPFNKYRPFIFCIETVHFTTDATSEKRGEIMNLMKKNGYSVFADTYVNTIFFDSLRK